MCGDGKQSMRPTDAAKLEQTIEYYREERVAAIKEATRQNEIAASVL